MTDTPASRRRRLSPLALTLILSASFFFVFVLITSMVLKRDDGVAAIGSGPKVGVLEVNGIIREGPAKRWIKRLREFEKSDSIKAVVLRVNSPGGAVAPSQEVYQALLKSKKPIVVSMASVAASGGYYIALGGTKIFANPGTITGSIGVIMEFANLEKLYDWAKISRFSIKSGKFKDAGADYRSMAPEERKLLQDMVDSTLGEFKSTVAKRRNLGPLESEAVSDGRIFSGEQAKAVKLVDELGTLDDAIRSAAQLAGISGEPKVVYPRRAKKSFFEWAIEEAGDRGDDSDEQDEEAMDGKSAWWLGVLRQVVDIPAVRPRLDPGVYWLLPWGY